MRNIFSLAVLASSLVLTATAQAATYQMCTSYGCNNSSVNPNLSVTSDYAKTQYPIVLAHGISGVAESATNAYWPGIPTGLVERGASVFLTSVSAYNSSEVRGEQLLKHVETIVAITNAGKVNLIGQSQGGQGIRYVAAVKPRLVASVTSVAGAHKGSPVADAIAVPLILGLPLTLIGAPIVNLYFNITDSEKYPQRTLAALSSLTTKGAAAFNVKYPQAVPTTKCGVAPHVVNGISYYSWGGIKSSPKTNFLFNGEQNDSLIKRCDTHLGRVIRDDYNLSHTQLNNESTVTPLENPLPAFFTHANRLKLQGY